MKQDVTLFIAAYDKHARISHYFSKMTTYSQLSHVCVCVGLYLSLVGVQLCASCIGPAQLLLQLAGTLHVHCVLFLQQTHLSAQVSQILQLTLVRLYQRLQAAHAVRRVPEGQKKPCILLMSLT